MKNKNILYGLLGVGALAGGYFFYKKFINSSGTYPLEVNKVSNNLVRVDVFKDNTDKILYSTFVSKRDLKNNGSYFGTLFENASFKLTEEQKTDGITHYFIFELYDSKGNSQQRFPFQFRLEE
jgi:hypothetical protein